MDSEVDFPTLVRQAKAGQSEAFGKIYDLLLDAIYRFVYFRVGIREEAEDITETVFMNAFTHLKTYEEHGIPFQAWMYRIARNKVIDYYRTRRPSVDINEAIDVADNADAIEDTAELHITYDLVLEAVKKLPAAYQEIIILKFIEEKENDEISIILDKPTAHIRVLQNRALNKLRTILHHE